MFDFGGNPVGGKITNYLLEKPRVVYQQKNERNYHIFYQMIKGATKDQKARWNLKDAKDFFYIAQSECFNVDKVDDKEEFDAVLDVKNIYFVLFCSDTYFSKKLNRP